MSNEKAIKYLEDEGWWDSEDGWSITTMANVMQAYADQENIEISGREAQTAANNKKLEKENAYLKEDLRRTLIHYGEYINQCINQKGVMSYPEIKLATEIWIEENKLLTNNSAEQ